VFEVAIPVPVPPLFYQFVETAWSEPICHDKFIPALLNCFTDLEFSIQERWNLSSCKNPPVFANTA
jgi:hypothetical protein